MSGKKKYPQWFDGHKINEILFCETFRKEHPMICINGTFFTKEGRVTDENRLRKEILEWIEPYVTSGLAKKITNLLDMLRVKCYSPPLSVHTDRIHLANGTYYLSGEFSPEKDFCVNRLPVSYDPEAASPSQWFAFLDQLLYANVIADKMRSERIS